MPAQKSYGRRKLDSSGGWGGGGSGGASLVQKRKREEERNPDMEPHLRAMDRLRELFYKNSRLGITCPEGAGGTEVHIKFHPKGYYLCDCSYLHVNLRGQTRADYIRSIDNSLSGYKGENFTRKREFFGKERNYIDGCQGQHHHNQGGRGDRHKGGDRHNRGTGEEKGQRVENWGDCGGNGNAPNLSHTQDGHR